jgi:hypothetical protein
MGTTITKPNLKRYELTVYHTGQQNYYFVDASLNFTPAELPKVFGTTTHLGAAHRVFNRICSGGEEIARFVKMEISKQLKEETYGGKPEHIRLKILGLVEEDEKGNQSMFMIPINETGRTIFEFVSALGEEIEKEYPMSTMRR